MKKIILWGLMVSALVAGCSRLSQSSEETLRKLADDNIALGTKLAVTIQAGKDGTLTVAEIEKAVQDIEAARQVNMEKLIEIKATENMTTVGLIGGAAGVLGRTALHAAASGVIPGIPGWIGALLALLLGGSTTKKKTVPGA